MFSEDVLAGVAFLLLLFFLLIAIRQAIYQDRECSRDLKRRASPERVPHPVLPEWTTVTLVLSLLLACAIWISPPNNAPISLSETPNPCKAPWFFVGIQELAAHIEHPLMVWSIPYLLLICLPWLDSRGPSGGYRLRARITTLSFVFVFLCVWLGLTVVSFFFRGPNWTMV